MLGITNLQTSTLIITKLSASWLDSQVGPFWRLIHVFGIRSWPLSPIKVRKKKYRSGTKNALVRLLCKTIYLPTINWVKFEVVLCTFVSLLWNSPCISFVYLFIGFVYLCIPLNQFFVPLYEFCVLLISFVKPLSVSVPRTKTKDRAEQSDTQRQPKNVCILLSNTSCLCLCVHLCFENLAVTRWHGEAVIRSSWESWRRIKVQ